MLTRYVKPKLSRTELKDYTTIVPEIGIGVEPIPVVLQTTQPPRLNRPIVPLRGTAPSSTV